MYIHSKLLQIIRNEIFHIRPNFISILISMLKKSEVFNYLDRIGNN